MTDHKPGVHEGFLVKRKLKLTGLERNSIAELEAELGNVIGVDQVSLELKPMRLQVAYDASMTSIDGLLAILAAAGVTPDSGWWTQYKLRWDRQIDTNILANAKHQPHCCGKPPPGK